MTTAKKLLTADDLMALPDDGLVVQKAGTP